MNQHTRPVSANSPVAEWLLPTSADTRLRLEKAVTRTDATHGQRGRALRTLGAVARKALVEEIQAKLREVLGDTLVDFVMGGWHTYSALTQAIGRSHSQPGIDQIVPLRNHTIKASRSHQLDIEVDSVAVMSLPVELVVAIQVFDAVAVVRDGRVVAIRSGQAKADGTVNVGGVEIAHRSLVFPLTAELVFHPASRSPQPAGSQNRAAG